MAKVIKQWQASDQPDADGVHVLISGRESGIMSWFMSLLGLDPTDTLTVTGSRVEFTSSSISGKFSQLVPINKVNNTVYGFAKPWKVAIAYAVVFIALGIFASQVSGMTALTLIIVGVVLAIVKYIFGKVFTVGFGDGDTQYKIEFKRSIIENQNISEEQAEHVCELIQRLIAKSGK
ncbi:hypothetical protein N8644_00475 [bacterium]|nr:hypothetical protein [bacterium]